MNDDLTRTLREHADDVRETHLTLDDVRGRARSVQRGRATVVGAALAVVVAIAAPVALLSGSGSDSDSPDPAPSPTRAVDPHRGDVLFLEDGVLTYEDGPWLPLPGDLRQTARSFTVLGHDRFVVVANASDGFSEGTLLDDRGTVVDRFPVFTDVATAPDGSGVAWVDPDRSVHLLVAGSDEIRTLPVGSADPIQVDAIDGDCTDLCTVSVRVAAPGDLGKTLWVSSQGTVTDGPAGVPAIVGFTADGSLFAGLEYVADDDIHVCSGVYGGDSGARLWGRCEDNRYDFSPDGTFVATTFAEGLGPSRVDIRDAQDGTEVAGLAGGWISSFSWEDDTHLLAVRVMDDGETSLLRLATDGSVETVLDGLHTDMDALKPAIILPSQG